MALAPFFDFDEARGEIQIMFDMPLDPPRFVSAPGLGEVSVLCGKPATSEKKKEVLTTGVLGVRGATLGVLRTELNPPGEKRPFAVGDCNQARTVADSSVRKCNF